MRSPSASAPGNRTALLARVRSARRAPELAALLIILAGLALVLWSNRGTWFYLDDWDFAVVRAEFTEGNLLGPQNQNWHLTTLLVYQALLNVFGIVSSLPFRLTSAAVFAVIGVLAYVYARRRVGGWWALLPLVAVMVTPSWEIVLWPFQIGQLLSVAAGLGALLLLEQGARRRAQIGAGVLLVVAVVSSSAGIPLLGIVILDQLLRPGRRRQLLAAVPALLLYAWWNREWASLTPNPAPADIPSFNAALRQVTDVADGAMQAMLGLLDKPYAGGLIAQLAVIALIVVVCWRLFAPVPADRRRILALVAGIVVYWFLLAWGRSNVPGYTQSPRYLFLSQILMVLLLVEVGHSLLLQVRAREGAFFARSSARPLLSVAASALVVVTVYAAWQSSQANRLGGHALRVQGNAAKGQAAALALLPADLRPHAPFYLDPAGMGLGRSGAQYFEGLRRFGSEPFSEAELIAMPNEAREFADRWLLGIRAAELAVGTPAPKPAGATPVVTPQPGLVVRMREKSGGACTKTSADADAATVTIAPAAGSFSVANTGQTPLFLHGRRYAAPGGTLALPIAPGAARIVALGQDAGTRPWELRVWGRSALICGLPA